LDVSDIVLESIASSETVLTPEEKELGVAIVDFGGGTTDLAIFSNNSIKHTSVLGLGGNNLTNDIAIGLRTPHQAAERIKRVHGCCLTSMINKEETIEVPSVGGRKPRTLSRQILGEILEPRVEEILSLVNREILKSGFGEAIASGVVVTGGGSLLEGIPELAEQIFNLPTRRGYPQGFGGIMDVVNSPMYATAVGLVLYGAKAIPKKKFRIRDQNIFFQVMERMKKWFREMMV
jgi:cell division protein FtsA